MVKRKLCAKLRQAIYQAGTLSGNPLAMAAGYETLVQLTPESYVEFERKAEMLEAGLRKATENMAFRTILTVQAL